MKISLRPYVERVMIYNIVKTMFYLIDQVYAGNNGMNEYTGTNHEEEEGFARGQLYRSTSATLLQYARKRSGR